ncbi:MAG: hypothetical protein WD939_05420 [Dehalococcoidia bacterium]
MRHALAALIALACSIAVACGSGDGDVSPPGATNTPDAPLLLVILVWTAGHIAVFGQPRYHYPLVPMFCLLAAWALAWAVSLWPQMGTDEY